MLLAGRGGITHAKLLLLAHALHVQPIVAGEALLQLLVEGLVPRRAVVRAAGAGRHVVGLRLGVVNGGRRAPYWFLHGVMCRVARASIRATVLGGNVTCTLSLQRQLSRSSASTGIFVGYAEKNTQAVADILILPLAVGERPGSTSNSHLIVGGYRTGAPACVEKKDR